MITRLNWFNGRNNGDGTTDEIYSSLKHVIKCQSVRARSIDRIRILVLVGLHENYLIPTL